MAQFIFKSMLAGVLIAIAGGIYIQCENRIIGAMLFAIGLIAVLVLDANLFTGKVGYVDTRKKICHAFFMMLINLVTAFLIGLLFRGVHMIGMAYPEGSVVAGFGAAGPFGEGSARFGKTWYNIMFDGFGCGVLIYLAVELFKKTNSVIPVVLCVMAFILSGAEHSVADAFYLGASVLTPKAFGYLWLVALGNIVGAVAVHWLQVAADKIPSVRLED